MRTCIQLGELENHGTLTWRRPFGSASVETVRRPEDDADVYGQLVVVRLSCVNERHIYTKRELN